MRAYAFGNPALNTATGPGLSFRLVDHRPELSARLASSAADLRWQVQSSGNAREWTDVSAAFAQDVTAEGLTLLGPPTGVGQKQQLYRLAFTVENGSGLQAGLSRLTRSDHYGIQGAASWQSDPGTGQLVSTADTSGALSRLVVEVDAPTLLEFDMSVQGGDESDSFAFYIDGVRVAQTSGQTVHVNRTLLPTEPVLLMWEFRRSTGTATIGHLPSQPPAAAE